MENYIIRIMLRILEWGDNEIVEKLCNLSPALKVFFAMLQLAFLEYSPDALKYAPASKGRYLGIERLPLLLCPQRVK